MAIRQVPQIVALLVLSLLIILALGVLLVERGVNHLTGHRIVK